MGTEGTVLVICAVAAHHKLDQGKEQMQSGGSTFTAPGLPAIDPA